MNEGRISISRPHFPDGRQALEIEIRGADEKIGVVLELDLAAFAKAVTGAMNQPCNYELRAWRPDGRTRKKDSAEPRLPLERGDD